VDISGTVSEFKRGEPVILTITKPDGTTEDRAVMASKQGTYSLPYQLTHNMHTGKYSLSVKYDDKEIESFSIEIISELIPQWIKNNARWWANGEIDDDSFISGIQFLIKEEIIVITGTPQIVDSTSKEIPKWIKTNAGWWSDNLISETEFVNGIKFLIENGIIKV